MEIAELDLHLKREFKMEDFREPKKSLGMEIEGQNEQDCLFISEILFAGESSKFDINKSTKLSSHLSLHMDEKLQCIARVPYASQLAV